MLCNAVPTNCNLSSTIMSQAVCQHVSTCQHITRHACCCTIQQMDASCLLHIQYAANGGWPPLKLSAAAVRLQLGRASDTNVVPVACMILSSISLSAEQTQAAGSLLFRCTCIVLPGRCRRSSGLACSLYCTYHVNMQCRKTNEVYADRS